MVKPLAVCMILIPAGHEASTQLLPVGRYGRPEEIAAAMAFLAPDEAAYITGQVLRVNDDMVMSPWQLASLGLLAFVSCYIFWQLRARIVYRAKLSG